MIKVREYNVQPLSSQTWLFRVTPDSLEAIRAFSFSQMIIY